jgi:hypothetical protein
LIRIGGYKSQNKYHAIQTEYRGVRYASKAEAARAAELDLLILAGKVTWWLRQVPIDIGEAGVDKPYRVDFLVCEEYRPDFFQVWAEDVKGIETSSFQRHLKQWRIRGPFPLHVIKNGKTEIIQGRS